jgi:hypothetical protein
MNRRTRAPALALLVLGAQLAPLSGQDAGRILEIERAGDTDSLRAWHVRAGDVDARGLVSESATVGYDDRFEVRSPWVVHLRLAMSRRGYGDVAVAADSRDRSGQTVLGPPAGDANASVRVDRARRGGARVELARGALFLTNWPASACMVAAGACTVHLGTAYALRVDDGGQAYLAVTEDSVEIVWWDGPDEPAQEPADLCEAVSPGTACRQMAAPGEVWTWSVTEPPRRWDNENQALLGFATLAGMYAALDDAVDFNGRDIWDDSIFKKPLFWVTTGAVLGGVACIIWCGGDDVTGTVIINP